VDAVDISVKVNPYGTNVYVNGRIVSEAALDEDIGTELAALGLVRGIMGLFGAEAAGAARSAVWSLANFPRGRAINAILGENLPGNFPVIDRFLNGVATSIKSLDLRAVSHLDPTKLERTLMGYVDKVAGFNGARLGGAVVDAGQITGRALEVAVPDGAMSAGQQAVFTKVTAAAAAKGVQVIVVPIK